MKAGLQNRLLGLFFDGRQAVAENAEAESRDAEIALVKLGGDDRVLDEELEGDDLEGGFVGGFEDDGTGGSGLLNLEPAGGADAPAVAGFEAVEAELRHRGGEVVAESLGGFEERSVYDAADGVDAEVVGAGLAAAGAKEAGHGLAAADVEGLAEDVFSAGLDGFGGWHGCSFKPDRLDR
jgi:hypothetical protein